MRDLYDPERCRRHTTVELIVESPGWKPRRRNPRRRDDDAVIVRVSYNEAVLRERAKRLGATWRPAELLARVRSVAPWDDASIYPNDREFPRIHVGWRDNEGFNVHCFENEQSLGNFLVGAQVFSPPTIEVNLGGQALERWPRELFVSEQIATQALEYFLAHGEQKPSLFWTGTGAFPRETIWEGSEERESWERTHPGQ